MKTALTQEQALSSPTTRAILFKENEHSMAVGASIALRQSKEAGKHLAWYDSPNRFLAILLPFWGVFGALLFVAQRMGFNLSDFIWKNDTH